MTITQATWVFGYGSLIWKQDFPFLECTPGHITGWVLMKADMDMEIDSYFADSRSKGPEGQNT